MLLQQEYIEKIKDIMEGYEHVRYFGGIGKPVNRLRELPASFEQASHAFAHRYLVQDSRILDSGHMTEEAQKEDNFDIKEVNPKQIDRTRIQEFLKQGDREEVVYFVEEFFRDLSNKALQSNIFRQYITMDAYFCVADFLESLSTDTQDPETPSQDEKTQQDSDSAIQYIIRILDKALEARDKAASSRYDDVVEQVMKYIDENYADEELSLNLLAYEQGKGTLALHRQAQQPDQPGGGLQGSTLFLLSVQEDPGNDPYPVPGRHQLAVAMDKGDSYEKKDKRIV